MANPLAESSLTQVLAAEADTVLSSARVYLVQTLREIETVASEEGGLTMEHADEDPSRRNLRKSVNQQKLSTSSTKW
jgi:hypothetical protein